MYLFFFRGHILVKNNAALFYLWESVTTSAVALCCGNRTKIWGCAPDRGGSHKQTSLTAVARALDEGTAIQKLYLASTSASEPDWRAALTLDASLAVSGLRFPKAENDPGEDAPFLRNIDICPRVADMVEALASA